ncbi:glutaredoxin family protein [Oceanobacillus massiliensis]|uniref:glutaredoxin family protein n=1 Tax=Oceanobacillus massiliensis TaxID=1465765 RepID=UPI00301A4E34
MSNAQVIIYVSDNSPQSEKVVKLIEENNMPYTIRNVSQNSDYMKELQSKEIYGTPATFINDQQPILGYQKNKIKYALGIDDNISHYSSLFDGFGK